MRRAILKTSVAAAAISVEIITGSAYAADPVMMAPQEFGQERLVFALGVGAQAFELPSLDVGVLATGQGDFDNTTDIRAIGHVFSVAVGSAIGDGPFFIEGIGSYSELHGDDRATHTFSGPGTFYIAGPVNPPGGLINLATNKGPQGASASADAVAVSGSNTARSDQNTTSPNGASSALNGYSPFLSGGGALTSVSANGSQPSAVALGAVGDGQGFEIAAVGDLGGLQLITDVEERVTQNLIEVRLGSSVPLNDSWSFIPTIAPTFRNIERDVSTRIHSSFSTDEIASRLPSIEVNSEEELSAQYYGGIVGGLVSGAVTDNLTASIGGDFGLAYYDASYKSISSAYISSSTLPYYFGTPYAVGPEQSEDDLTYLARAKTSMSYDMGRASLSFGAQIEYLADVPTLRRNNYVNASLGPNGAVIGSGDGSATSRLSSDEAWSYGANVGFALAF